MEWDAMDLIICKRWIWAKCRRFRSQRIDREEDIILLELEFMILWELVQSVKFVSVEIFYSKNLIVFKYKINKITNKKLIKN